MRLRRGVASWALGDLVAGRAPYIAMSEQDKTKVLRAAHLSLSGNSLQEAWASYLARMSVVSTPFAV